MKVRSTTLLLICVFAGLPVFAQPKKLAAEIEAMKASKLYVFVQAEGVDETDAELIGRKKLLSSIEQEAGILEPARNVGGFESLEKIGSLKKANSDIVTEKFVWKEKKKAFAVVYAKKSVAKNYAIAVATSAYRDIEEWVYGEYTDKDVNSSSNNAKGNLIAQIQQRVETDRTVSTQEERKGEIGKAEVTKSEKFQSQSKVLSRMSLQGLKTITLKFDDTHYTFAYISRPDIETSFESIRLKVVNLAGDGEKQFSEGNVGMALSSFYRAYIMCDAHYTTIPYTFKSGEKTQDVRSALETKIASIIDSIKVEAKQAYERDETLTVVPISASFRGKPISNMYALVEYGSFSSGWPLNVEGTILELVNFTPTGRISSLKPKLLINIDDFLSTDQTLADLAPSRMISIQKDVPVDFSNIYKFNVEAEFNEFDVKFKVVPRNKEMVSVVKWDFGDGTNDLRSNLTTNHTYDDKKTYKIRVEVNNDPFLAEERYVDLPTKRIRMNPPPACTNCEKVETPVERVITVKPAFEELKGIKTTAGLFATMTTLKNRGVITFGNQKSIGDSEGALVMVVDEKNVFDQLIFSGNRYFQITTKEPVSNLVERYAGKRLIWIKQL